MKLPRRNFLHLAAGAAALPTVSRIALAETYPGRPVRVIVPFAAGGGSDILARLIGQWLSERLGRPFIVENRPGGAGNIGTGAVAHALSNDVAALNESVGSQGRDAGRLYAPPGECAANGRVRVRGTLPPGCSCRTGFAAWGSEVLMVPSTAVLGGPD